MQEQKPDIRYIITHRPGPTWKAGVEFREQPGVMQHVEYFQNLKSAGKLALGGPFLDNSGGMMIPSSELTPEEVEILASEDPSVKSGLVKYEIVPWYIAMKAD